VSPVRSLGCRSSQTALPDDDVLGADTAGLLARHTRRAPLPIHSTRVVAVMHCLMTVCLALPLPGCSPDTQGPALTAVTATRVAVTSGLLVIDTPGLHYLSHLSSGCAWDRLNNTPLSPGLSAFFLPPVIPAPCNHTQPCHCLPAMQPAGPLLCCAPCRAAQQHKGLQLHSKQPKVHTNMHVPAQQNRWAAAVLCHIPPVCTHSSSTDNIATHMKPHSQPTACYTLAPPGKRHPTHLLAGSCGSDLSLVVVVT
jgi:hypothetical protein